MILKVESLNKTVTENSMLYTEVLFQKKNPRTLLARVNNFLSRISLKNVLTGAKRLHHLIIQKSMGLFSFNLHLNAPVGRTLPQPLTWINKPALKRKESLISIKQMQLIIENYLKFEIKSKQY